MTFHAGINIAMYCITQLKPKRVMKKITLLSLLLLITYFLSAQSGRDSTNQIFSEISKLEITSGILIDRASPDLNLAKYAQINDSASSLSVPGKLIAKPIIGLDSSVFSTIFGFRK